MIVCMSKSLLVLKYERDWQRLEYIFFRTAQFEDFAILPF
jgi:hypothetical protein